MYQSNEKNPIDVAIMASEIADWSITRYGYFINSSVDKLDMVQAFAEELSRLPKPSLRYVDQAKNKWIDYAHKRPPTMPDFLNMLREFYNSEMNEKRNPQIESKIPDYWKRWQICETDKDKSNFFRSFSQSKCPPATKYWIREDMRKDGVTSKNITKALGYGWA